MLIKDILVYIDSDSACENRLRTAVGLCNETSAHLTGLYVQRRLMVPAYVGAYIPPEVFEANSKEIEEIRHKTHSTFTQRIDTAGVSGELVVSDSDTGAALNMHSRYTDVMLLPQRATDEFDLNPYYELPSALLHSACPVMMVPRTKLPTLPIKRVLLGWSGGRECARAMQSAISLFPDMENIDVVSVDSDVTKASDIALHISRHGFNCEVHMVDGSHADAGAVLLDKAQSLESDMLVMGAYGHSRLRELVIGGVTQHVMNNATLPVLFSH